MPSAVFILIADGRVLMEQRLADDDGFFPNEWLFPGGKLEDGEEPVAALMREATEELGIAIVDATPLCGEEEVFYARPGEQSHRLYPWLVTRWYGEADTALLTWSDKGLRAVLDYHTDLREPGHRAGQAVGR